MERFLRKKLVGGKFKGVSSVRSKMMGAVKGQGNKTTELKFCQALKRVKLSGWKTHEKLVGSPDISFPYYKIAIFLDGCFWHGCPKCGHIPRTNSAYWKAKIERNKERDIQKAEALKEQGYLVLRFWEHDLAENLEECLAIVHDAIESRLILLVEEDIY